MWFNESNIYQIYPLGMCGCPYENPSQPVSYDLAAEAAKEGEHRAPEAFADASETSVHGAGFGPCVGASGQADEQPWEASGETSTAQAPILTVLDYIDHIKACGFDTVLFNPLFECDEHGYDTRNFRLLDRRLGTNEDLKTVCRALKEAGLRVMLDGVFNHVGRGFFAFQDVLKNREQSPYRNWFYINFGGNSPYNDGFSYSEWEGCYNLVKLNLSEPAVRDYIFESIRLWHEEFGVSGLRLDVAYCIDRDFLRALRTFTRSLDPEFFLFGEIMHGDYKTILQDDMMDSVTNYECRKGLVSSMNSMNLFEIAYSLNRQFGKEPWCLYTGKQLISFVDNHDVTRAASELKDERQLKPLYGLMFGMPGIPAVYYGSEWGMKGEKTHGDRELRLPAPKPQHNELTDFISALAKARKESRALIYGDYTQLLVTNKQLIFERSVEGERVIVAVNADSESFTAHFDARSGLGFDLITGEKHDFGGGSELKPFSVYFWRTER